ncbi:phosphatase PAP2 family protein [Riemerella anatipestifer]|uniref:Phosphoesterase pa-phosphatase-like protein n=1 Tax=Riemerella anatipestifer TaxID=34085 RepID=A0A1S7DVX3_RIEAN|nr:phosphatase PAP2 family protein [Riemerella anatipestifer]AQY23228.1 phosphoesterase pa-phosphatase-like protein [Riemerella anatipestifer]MCO4304147.1 phosphatase PAP2 family protein [Riemerella anatipestifer]MCO7352953.1 phosphatase PAP2 family protein [Riemerella anatipestifer]MCQ4039470.1 phosphatase PAP2 family protein [Riemerella anatipestifer]MCT6761155.1 phosphatase PAP2 family protein [Riemerella anatipestifer]
MVMNTNVVKNQSKVVVSFLYLPAALLLMIVLWLWSQNALSIIGYTEIQKEVFLYINHQLGQYPSLMINLTQFGNALVFLSCLSIFIIYAPKLWEALISASLVSLLFSKGLKNLFSVPRPAAMFDVDTFIIVGEKLTGHSSLPSGHSITVFTILTVLMFSFMPRSLIYKMLWSFFIIIMGLMLVSTRVGVGAHYPLDTIVGGIIGYISGVLGILFSQKYKTWNWIADKKYSPVFIVLFTVCIIIISKNIFTESLVVFYLPLVCLAISLFKIGFLYVKK